MKRRILVPALSALLLAAAPPTAPTAAPGGRWAVDFGDYQCSLVRQTGGSDAFVIRRPPGSSRLELRWVNSEWSEETRPRSAELFLEPGHVRIDDFVPVPLANGQGVGSLFVDYRFLQRFAAATTIVLYDGSKAVKSIRLPGVGRAVQAFASCNDAGVRDFGADPVLLESLREAPKSARPLSSLIANADYPSAALRENASGTVRFRLDVGVDGRVKHCAVIISSGHPSLDETTCRIMRERARFSPAIGPNGAPVQAPVFAAIVWSILS
jgi:TonB family protein